MSFVTRNMDSLSKLKKDGLQKRRKYPIGEKIVATSTTPSIVSLYISKGTQIALGCEVGTHVTPKNPWTTIEKKTLLNDIKMYAEESELFSIKDLLLAYPEEEVAIGYDPASEYEDVFLICVTNEGVERVRETTEARKETRKHLLENAFEKPVGTWKNLGSDLEIDKINRMHTRPLIVVKAETDEGSLRRAIEFSNSVTSRASFPSLGTDKPVTIPKMREETGVQTAAQVCNTNTQTETAEYRTCGSQFETSSVVYEKLADKQTLAQNINSMLGSVNESLEYHLNQNILFDVYSDDYSKLCREPADRTKFEIPQPSEYETYLDANRCKGTVISALAWNASIPSIIAVAYVKKNRWSLYYPKLDGTDKEQRKERTDVFDRCYVLIWSVNEPFLPQLYLECPQEAHRVSFCPYNENFLIGGLISGQIIIWDLSLYLPKIGDKNNRENVDIHRRMMANMKWMNFKQENIVEPAAVSSYELSHLACVTAINWLSPFREIRPDGLMTSSLTPNKEMQFLTTSEDGNINVWSMSPTPRIISDSSYGRRRRKKTRARPDKILSQVSQLRCLYRTMIPVFQMSLFDKGNAKVPLSYISSELKNFQYVERKVNSRNPNILQLDFKVVTLNIELPTRNYNIWDFKFMQDHHSVFNEVAFDLQPHVSATDPEASLMCGSHTGCIFKVTWDPFDTSIKQPLLSQKCKVLLKSDIHDGPVTQILRNPFIPELIACVGGRVISFWHDDYPKAPLRWFRGLCLYAAGVWSPTLASVISVGRTDGQVETWALIESVSFPAVTKNFSGNGISGLWYHHYMSQLGFFLLTDDKATVKLYKYPLVTVKDTAKTFETYLKEEISRKQAMLDATQQWFSSHERISLTEHAANSFQTKKILDESLSTETKPSNEETKVQNLKNKTKTYIKLKEAAEVETKKRACRLVTQALDRKGLHGKVLTEIGAEITFQEGQDHCKKQKQRTRLQEKHTEHSRWFSEKKDKRPTLRRIEVTTDTILKHNMYNDYLSMEEEYQKFVTKNPYTPEIDARSCLLYMEQRNEELVACRNIKDIRDRRQRPSLKSVNVSIYSRTSTDDWYSEEVTEEEKEEEEINWDKIYEDDFDEEAAIEDDSAEGQEEKE